MRTMLVITAILLLFVAARAALLVEPGVFLGWNSDAAIFWLMAKRMLEGRGFDIFFLGQNYMGPLPSIVAAILGGVRDLLGMEPRISPLTLRLATCITVGGGIALYLLALRRAGLAVASLLAAFLAIGPPLLYRSSLTATGPDIVFFLGGLIAWYGFPGRGDTGTRGRGDGTPGVSASPGLRVTVGWRFGFGILCGVSWWMNQGALFFIAAAAWLLARETNWWKDARGRLRLRDRLLFRNIPFSSRRLLLLLELVILADLAYLTARDLFGWTTPLTGFRWPFAEPLLILLATHILVMVWQREQLLTATSLRALTRFLSPIVAGVLVGYGPVLLGRLLDWYPQRYSFGVRLSHPSQIAHALAAIFTTVLPTLYGNGFAAVLVLVLALRVWLLGRWPSDRAVSLVCLAAALNLGFFVLTQRPGYKTHYLMAAVPGAWLLAAIGVESLWRSDRVRKLAAVVSALALAVSLGLGARKESALMLADRDPRPVLSKLKEAQCAVCYAEYWTAYKYRFLSNEAMFFIPYQSLDRTPEDTLRFRAAPGRRCLLEPDGTVRPLG